MIEPNTFPLAALYFYLTEGCNLACRHCWLAPKFDADGTRHPTLPLEAFEQAVAEARPLGLDRVKLTGGEPLLHPRIREVLEVVRRDSLGLSVETNGVLCTPDLARLMGECRSAFVAVSVDGACAATHEWVRGVPGSFAKALQAVRSLVAAGVDTQIVMSVMRHNAGEIPQLVELAGELGAGSVKFNLVQPTARGEALHARDGTLSVPQLLALGRRVEEELAPRAKASLHFDYPVAFRPLHRIASAGEARHCGVLGILGVLANGDYALCGIGSQVPDLVFGHIGREDLATVWNRSRSLVALREGLPGKLEGVCGRCLMNGFCLASCVAQNHYRTKRIFAPFWFCEQAEEAGLFPASRLR